MKEIAIAMVMACACSVASAQIPDIKSMLRSQQGSSVGGERAAEGLKEALQVGTANAVKLTGRQDGYFGNEAIRILMPEKLKMVEKGLRAVGYGPKVDEFVLSMNRAAESAAPAAREIFVGALREMTFDDARRILGGGDNAATEYFRSKTSERLRASFRPVVEKSMAQAGVTQRYDDLIGRYRSVPFARGVSFDVNDYVVDAALAGLFHMIAREEKEIRTNPAARVTDLLRSTFG